MGMSHADHIPEEIERKLLPSDECQEVITLLPTDCRCCGETLKSVDAEPWRHQVWELPEMKRSYPSRRVILSML